MGSGLLFYFKLFPSMQWKPDFSYNLGSATHFVHDPEKWEKSGIDEDYEGTPLNREWSVSFIWLFFYISVTLTKELPYDSKS